MHGSTTLVIMALLAAIASVAQADKKKELMPRYIKYALECMKEGNVQLDVCKEMHKEGNDNSQEKYQPCKCSIACVAKKANAMTGAGEANIEGLTAAIEEFEIPEWNEEWKRVLPLCKPIVEGKKNCDLGFDFFSCSYEKSEIFRGVIAKVVGAIEKPS